MNYEEYRKLDALALASLVAKGEVTAAELLCTALARCNEVNPKINAVSQLYDGPARKDLDSKTQEGPLAGVPFLLKDLGALEKDRPVSNGSRLWEGFVAPIDFTYTERLKKAGVTIFGRTSSPELGINWTTEPVAFGPTRNPWNLNHSAGGSSGGAAAAVAAGIVPAAHATDGGGSIRIPAANCGIFGLKPTRARNPSGPVVGEGWSGMSCGHVVSRSVRDSAAFLDATHGPAPGDPYAAPEPSGPFLDEVGKDPGKLRIAMHKTGLEGEPLDPVNQEASDDAAKLLESLGHTVEEAMPKLDVPALTWAARVIIAGNLWTTISARYAELGREADGFGLEKASWAWAEEGQRYRASDYASAVSIIHAAGRQYAAFMQNHDILLSTVMGTPPAPIGYVRQDERELEDFMSVLLGELPVTPLYNMTGAAAMSVPLYWSDDGLPIGVHFGGLHGGEATLLRLAAQLEEARPWFDRVPEV